MFEILISDNTPNFTPATMGEILHFVDSPENLGAFPIPAGSFICSCLSTEGAVSALSGIVGRAAVTSPVLASE